MLSAGFWNVVEASAALATGGGSARASIAADDGERVALLDVEIRAGDIDLSDVAQRNHDVGASPGGHREVLVVVRETELEGDVRRGVAVVVDADLVQRGGVERK